MYNTEFPGRAALPSPAALLRSTAIAIVGAIAILFVFVLPADYGIDPTGLGRRIGLLDMGKTKARLAAEAAADRDAADAIVVEMPAQQAQLTEIDAKVTALEAAVERLTQTLAARPATNDTLNQSDQAAQEPAEASPQPAPEPEPAEVLQEEPSVAAMTEETAAAQTPEAEETSLKSDRATFTLTPGQGIEIKLVMKSGAVANYLWTSEGGPVNYDTHGDGPGGNKISYAKGRAVTTDQGSIVAAFDGNHGWFWRNRGQYDVAVTLITKGYYTEMKGVPQ